MSRYMKVCWCDLQVNIYNNAISSGQKRLSMERENKEIINLCKIS